MLKKQLGQRIKTLRLAKKYTQEKFAELVGIDSKNISKIETGSNYPSSETLKSIANALNIDVYELFVFNNEIDYEKIRDEIISSLDDKKHHLFV